MKVFSLFLLLVLFSFAKEPSAFEKQSGATKKDLSTLQNSIQSLNNVIENLQSQTDGIKQSQEGLQSLYESQSQKLQTTANKALTNEQEILALKTELENLKKQSEENTKNITLLQSQIKEMQALVVKTQDSILTQLEKLNANNAPKATTQESKKPQDSKPKTFDKTKQPELFAQAKEHLNAKRYKDSKEILLWLKSLNYNQPEVLFYLGEVAYLQKDYNLAIRYYKQSVGLSEQGKYIPTLLLHSALSFKGIKDLTNYNNFLEALIANYPKSKEAAQARELQSKNSNKPKSTK
ncbi:hypothetical protein CQA49_03425 [Helicobacter sp. MIT 00-7814]|uniref:tetratricopeptide repeat protein n=1 Tax=unclassified Helicobacter TaxID=2593540 RepID=UPI000E1EEB0E|nr:MULTISPECIES: tetratricopeptide repeat protein [unclassified Helicobacter]RDU55523.1 hypothetical protein CQA37_03845 [Helicobacter sp. MIT 99-10781]RDU55613.1 hypothetical protein CQA49_03425 [Helicobacter sp. MIT 00-7814]